MKSVKITGSISVPKLHHEMSRETFGQVRGTRSIPNKRAKKEKHGKRELSRRMEGQ